MIQMMSIANTQKANIHKNLLQDQILCLKLLMI